MKGLVKAAATSRAGCGHLSLQSIGSARMDSLSSVSAFPLVKPMAHESFNCGVQLRLPGDESFAAGIVAGYLLQCAAHTNEEYMVCHTTLLKSAKITIRSTVHARETVQCVRLRICALFAVCVVFS